MDVEQLCLDEGAAAVITCRNLDEARNAEGGYDAAVLDVMADGEVTLPFAADLRARDIPFIFASGYAERDDIRDGFPEIRVVNKPYSGNDLVEALAAAIAAASRGG
ncbi:MAG: response regulator [Rhizobiales bacterium]|nr:response regulator [Hyphomicrobiales bacterium]